MSPPHRALKILDYTPSLGMGGIATGMIRVLETIDRDTYDIDFLLVDDADQYYEPRARELGSDIYHIASHRKLFLFTRQFFKINKAHGPFDVIHSHAYTFSGYIMFLAWIARIPIRISHSHAARPKSLRKQPYVWLMRMLANCFSTGGLAISMEAGNALFGSGWHKDPRMKLLPVGTDFRPFERKVNKEELKSELGIPKNKKVIGIIGQFTPPKNHMFSISFIAEFIQSHTDCVFLFAGDGVLQAKIYEQVKQLKVDEYCIFTGVRKDLPVIYTHVLDAVLFPSLHEGLGRVAVEAQAAGLPVIASEHIPSVADLYEGGVTRLPLNAPMEEWVSAMEAALRRGKKPLNEALEIARMSPLSMDYHIGELEEFYAQQAIKAGLR